MGRCAACGSTRTGRWFFYRTERGLITTCSSTCRDAYLAGQEALEDEEKVNADVAADDDSIEK